MHRNDGRLQGRVTLEARFAVAFGNNLGDKTQQKGILCLFITPGAI
jgi:hypothetical protein